MLTYLCSSDDGSARIYTDYYYYYDDDDDDEHSSAKFGGWLTMHRSITPM